MYVPGVAICRVVNGLLGRGVYVVNAENSSTGRRRERNEFFVLENLVKLDKTPYQTLSHIEKGGA